MSEAASMSRAETIIGSHEYKFTGYSLSKGVGIGKYISSETFMAGGYTWAIYFYPDGRRARDNSNYISVFIALVESEATDVRALFELILLDQSGRARHKVHSHFTMALPNGPATLRRGSLWGYNHYFTRTALEASNYLKDDCLQFRCRVGVVKFHTGPKTYSVPLLPSDIGQHFGKLLESGKGTDVNFVVDGETSSAHKLGLAAQSPDQLHGPMKDKNSCCLRAEGMDASDFKKIRLSTMDSAISLMREMVRGEKVSEQAKVEAAIGGTDILMKSEELKHVLKQAEEINSMHSVEVYSGQAILATELRELQSRILSLSIERDKYLAVLDEMQQTLEVRLAEAQNVVIKSAEQEKETAAIKSLTELELIKKKALQVSKCLNQQAADNAKLRERLVDRGHVVDMLQGEVSAICQDVRVLKEKLDDLISFSKSLSSNQTCSVPSSKSLIPEQVISQPLDPMDTQKKNGTVSCSTEHLKSLIPEQVVSLPCDGVDPMDTQTRKGTVSCSTEHSSRDDGKALSDEWEMLDGDTFSSTG